METKDQATHQSFYFYTLVGSRIFLRDLPGSEKIGFMQKVGQRFRIIEAQDSIYCATLLRCCSVVNGQLQNEGPVVMYQNQDYQREELKQFLAPLGFWHEGQFGIWSFGLAGNP
jgi:hypothetical protein